MTGALVVSCGEPAGIGPEVAAKAWEALRAAVPFAWIGDPRHLPLETPWEAVEGPEEAAGVAARALPVLARTLGEAPAPGRPEAGHARGVMDAIAEGAALALAGRAGALVTAPIHKAALARAGFSHPGHTEFLQALAGGPPVVMMLASDALRVVPATIHVALRDVPALLTPTLLEQAIRVTHAGLVRDFGIDRPRIAVAGLNPHAGEEGRMGTEDVEVIAPVVARLRAEGMRLSGPHPADTLFHAAARARYDAALCMYHDQALIPVKTLAFDEGVNVTLGLPFVRTSPDHGTAFDIAGQGVANPSSMIAALRMAWAMRR
jgi:4-hydroxythreonine-4-phosphate dehydrogenase